MSEQRDIPFGRPWVTDEDRAAVLRVLDGHVLTHGPECKAFEAEFSAFMGGEAASVTVSSCMAALHLACLHFGFHQGDDVIVPAQTHTATVHAVEWTGATPVFVDCDPTTGNVTAEALEAAVTARTRGIVLVHFVGIPCDMPSIMRVAERHQLRVIEDCALAVGARWKGRHVGLFGDAGCFSFYPVKHMTTAEGGMFVSKHREVADAVARLRAFGVDRTHGQRSIPGMYDVPVLGLNYRMSELQAALGRSQLRRMPENLERRRENFERLRARLAEVPGVLVLDDERPGVESSHYCLTAVLDTPLAGFRREIVAHLKAAGVGTSTYYPHPVPRMTYYRRRYPYDPDRYVGAEQISDASVALPAGPHVSVADADYIGRQFEAACQEVRA